MKQKKLLPGQLIFGIFTCLLLPVAIMVFFLDLPAVFLYTPLFAVPPYLLFSALALFPAKKAIALWVGILLPMAVICALLAIGTPGMRAPLAWVLGVLTVLVAIAAILVGIIAISASNICLGWGSAALAFGFLEGALGFCLLDQSEELFWKFGLGLAPLLIICAFIIADLWYAIGAVRKETLK